ncbi:MAG: leucine--tRNA ligase [Candidatus Bathyarchaeota archaeon]|nr:leucine--tRNA ligase [Candidatus Bathyarchaeota archaeon]
MGIKDQHDPRADEATKILYKKEFHAGLLKQNCGPYAGRAVREVKETLIQDFKKAGIADSMYDLPQPVVCRCMTPCIVKILSDQWFLNYSDPAWKGKAKAAIAQMKIYPEAARQWFITVIDWLKEWACARTTGFGTPLPWGKGWIIETLSDSTIYMAFYTINKHIRAFGIKPEQLTPEVFDYIFYGKGEEKALNKATGISDTALRAMHEEFLYWYPFDLRVSAKELVPNHLSFCIFHHVALFPPKHWPRAIGVNGMLMIEGKQMHKSKGNFVTMKNAIERYGADATRCALLLGAEGMDDPDWRSDNAADIRDKLETLRSFALGIIESAKLDENTHLERWLLSRMQQRIAEVTANLEELKTRSALEVALFEVWNDFRWYIRRKGNASAKAARDALDVWLRLLAPFAPHICEELWSAMGKDTFITLAEWPRVDKAKVDPLSEEQEAFITDLIDDTLNVLKATKIKPKQICYYTAAGWKWQVYRRVMARAAEGEVKINEVMKELAQDPSLKANMKEVAGLVPKMLRAVSKLPAERKVRITKIEALNEKDIIEAARGFLEERFNAEIAVYSEEDKARYDPKQRAVLALPGQPAIYIE